MNQAEHSARLRALNSEGRTFWRTVEGRFEKLIQERPDVLKCAVEEMDDWEKMGAFHCMPSLEHIVFRIARYKAAPKRRGRPRQNDPQTVHIRNRIEHLKNHGHSWSEVSHKLSEEGIYISASGCRYRMRNLANNSSRNFTQDLA